MTTTCHCDRRSRTAWFATVVVFCLVIGSVCPGHDGPNPIVSRVLADNSVDNPIVRAQYGPKLVLHGSPELDPEREYSGKLQAFKTASPANRLYSVTENEEPQGNSDLNGKLTTFAWPLRSNFLILSGALVDGALVDDDQKVKKRS